MIDANLSWVSVEVILQLNQRILFNELKANKNIFTKDGKVMIKVQAD